MKVLFVITGLNTGGAELMLLRLLSGLNRGRFQCEVVNMKEPGAVQPMIEALGIPVHCLKMRYGLFSIFGFRKLMKIIQRFSPDVIQGWMIHANFSSILARRLAGRFMPVIWGMRYSLTDLSQDKWITRQLIRICGKMSGKAAKIVYNSHVSAEQHEKMGYDAAKTLVIPNGIDFQGWLPAQVASQTLRSELSLSNDALLIGLIGRFDAAKDHETFFGAAKKLVDSHPQARFILAGPGINRENKPLVSLISSPGLTHHVHLLDERKDIPFLISSLDVLTSSSRTESMSNVILEGMASGVPCVVTDAGDSAKVVGEAGMVVPKRDPAALSEAWKKLFSMSPRERRELGEKGRVRVEKHYSLTTMIEAYRKLYEDVGIK